MLAGRTNSLSFAGTAILAAALLTATVRVDAADAADAAEEARAERLIRRHIPGLTPEERDRRAAASGELHVRGRTRLSGTVFAKFVHVEKGAEVEIDGDLVIYATDGIVIDAPIGGSARVQRRKGLKIPPPGTGTNGDDGAKITMISGAGDMYVDHEVTGNPGESGESEDLTGPFARGGDGGRGGDILIFAKKKGATIVVRATIHGGDGGSGGDAKIVGGNGAAGLPGQDVTAFGGAGGDAGDVNISATNVVFEGSSAFVDWPHAAGGGTADATGGAGGDAAGCFGPRAGNGGSARAQGGDAGRGSNVVIVAKSLTTDQTSVAGAGAYVAGAETTLGGGDAAATAGAGGGPFLPCPQTCPASGRDGSDGASSGSVWARGGNGAVGSRILGSAFRRSTPAAVEQDASSGGSAIAYPVSGRDGQHGEDAARPGLGGRGGDVGRATSIGGKGGACRVGTIASGTRSYGGKGGDARVGGAAPANSGSGGAGGNCCPNEFGLLQGGTGGHPGDVGATTIAPGKGGRCKSPGAPGSDGAPTNDGAGLGAVGGVGADCPVVVGDVTMSDATLDDPLHVNVNSPLKLEFTNRGAQVSLHIEVCCDKKPIGHFDFVVGAGDPGLPFVAQFIATLYISAKHAAHHISIMINGKTVKEFIREVL